MFLFFIRYDSKLNIFELGLKISLFLLIFHLKIATVIKKNSLMTY